MKENIWCKQDVPGKPGTSCYGRLGPKAGEEKDSTRQLVLPAVEEPDKFWDALLRAFEED